jgi:hypothetical protein
MKFPKIPKPLLIVIVIIVILGVVSCGAGVFRGLTEGDKPAASDAAGVDGLAAPSVAATDVTVRPPDNGSSCSKKDEDSDGLVDDITMSESCDVFIKGQFLPHVLRLGVASVSSDISVQQEIDGKLQPDDPDGEDVDVGDIVEISATGLGEIHVRINCDSCLFRIAG